MKTVLVTGGTIRLGRAIAERLRADGWRVITSSHRADAGADIVADLSEPMGAAKLYAAALQMLGGNQLLLSLGKNPQTAQIFEHVTLKDIMFDEQFIIIDFVPEA